MTCSACNNSNRDGARFCSGCGASLAPRCPAWVRQRADGMTTGGIEFIRLAAIEVWEPEDLDAAVAHFEELGRIPNAGH
jgi:hypothetical protein